MRDILYGLLLAALASTLPLGSCGFAEHGDNEETQVDSTYFRATLNGEENWRGEGRAILARSGDFRWLTVVGDTLHEQNYPHNESLQLSVAYRGPREYSLVRMMRSREPRLISGTSYFESDGDVTIASYHSTDDTSANQLTIASYDSTTGLMEGTFRTTVVVDSADRVSEPGEPPRRRPDTLRFTDGEFRVTVEDRR